MFRQKPSTAPALAPKGPWYFVPTALAVGVFTCGSLAASNAAAEEPQPKPAAPTPASDSTHELEAIVVEKPPLAPPVEATSSGTKITSEELAVFEHNDVHQVVLQVPGVQVRGEDGLGLRPNIGIRGTSPDRSAKVTLMEDGVLFGPAPYSAPAAYYFPMVNRMTEVDVEKGGAQVRYGPNALGGAIDMKTAPIEAGVNGSFDVAYGQYNYRKIHARGGYGAERTGFLLEGLYAGTDGFKRLDGGGNTGYDKSEWMAKWRLNSDPAKELYQELEIKLGFSQETSNETYLGLSDADFADSPYRRYVSSENDQMNFHRGQTVLGYRLLFGDDLEFRTTLYRHQFTRDWFKFENFTGADVADVLQNPTSPRNRIYYEILTGQADSAGDDENIVLTDNYRWFISQGAQFEVLTEAKTGPIDHKIETGLRLHYDEVNRQHTAHYYSMRGSSGGNLGHLASAGIPDERTTENHGDSLALSLHAVDTLSVEALTLTPGLRLEVVGTRFVDHLDSANNNDQTQVAVLPGLGSHYALFDGLGVLAGVYRGFGPVSPQPLTAGEPEAKPEESIILEGGARYLKGPAHAELIGFFNDYQNLTAVCSESRGCSSEQVGTQFNGGQANVYGLEAILAYRLTAAHWEFPARATYALTYGEFLGDFSSSNPEWGQVTAGDELPYLPRHQGTVQLGFGMTDSWSVDVNTTFASASREIAGQGEAPPDELTDAYALVGLAARARAYKNLWVYTTVTNLLDTAVLASRRPHGARPLAPRWIQIGLKLDL